VRRLQTAMHAFNLTRLNFHSPYKVWIDNGSYKFLTDYGVQYRIEFVENNNIWEDEKAYEFGILNENKKNSPNDSKVKATIQCIIEEFFLTNPDILLYQCETGDSRQAMRARLFTRWFISAKLFCTLAKHPFVQQESILQIDSFHRNLLRCN